MCCDGDVKVDIGGARILNIDRNGGLSPLFHFAFYIQMNGLLKEFILIFHCIVLFR